MDWSDYCRHNGLNENGIHKVPILWVVIDLALKVFPWVFGAVFAYGGYRLLIFLLNIGY